MKLVERFLVGDVNRNDEKAKQSEREASGLEYEVDLIFDDVAVDCVEVISEHDPGDALFVIR
jgi:hypothetical protein